MSSPSQSSVTNRLLKRMSEEAFGRIRSKLELRDLPIKHKIVEPGVRTEGLCFIENGLASIVSSNDDGEAIEVGHIGFEGVTGTNLLLSVSETPTSTFMQVAGRGYMLSADDLENLVEEDRSTQKLLLTFVHAMQIQVSQTSLANGRYRMHERLARWLLMCHDRVGDDELPLTHEFMALMLGVRRSGVTDELHVLEGLHAIKATRGRVHIQDRQGLEKIAGLIYGLPEREYERLLGGN
ncbi:Crp/Fnr family transcriptional regulator [Rhizobium sp. NFR03]|uniref:Crp/Fnr family transcriptional regulator n=1 Tax=Rhizobium sp. NFR03 TaxID=1566263 RepID=UPI0008D2B6D1|nr:Crp/Fnr family transcriptional regulator [Rhizobium sp. NFR03]SES47131.1 cAMP-binding domain of CRP or a regulatory subunit of cAMP-dependent protein kinases [Rhizobium sp. NFR03]